jgi:hypothetical protein
MLHFAHTACRVLCLLLLAGAAAAAQPPAADYELGFRDAVNQQASRDKDRSNARYGEGYQAGQSRRAANAAAGADFELGYKDGYNKSPYRDRDRSNKRYGEGFKAGQGERQANATALPRVAAPAPAAAGGGDYQLGYRDALNKQASRDRDRSNKAYADGYKAGQAKSAAIATSGPDFELGFRDAFNKAEYRDRDRSNKRYAEGYKAGQMERDAPVTAGSRPGMAAPTRLGDLVGRSAANLDSSMKSLGYARLGGVKKGRDSSSTWAGNGGCARITERDGKITEATDMGDRAESSSCR